MKEHTDDVLSSVKESAATVDATSSDEIATKRGKIEGIFGETDEKDDVMVDVVSADASVDNHGASKIELVERVTRDQVIEDVSVVKEVSDDLVEGKVVNIEKVEVFKEVIRDNTVKTVASGADCNDQKAGNGSVAEPVVEDSKMATEPVPGDAQMATEPSKPSSKELEAGEEETGVNEPICVVADVNHVVEETDVLSSSTIPESIEGCVVAKDKAKDGVNDQSSLTEVVDEGTGEDKADTIVKNLENQDGVDQTNKSTIEATTNGVKKSETGDSNMIVESVNTEPQNSMKKEDCMMNEKTAKDEVLDSKKIPESPTVVNEVFDQENAEIEVDQTSIEESSQSTIEARTDNASKSDEPQVIEGKSAVKDENKATVEHRTGSVQEVRDEDHVTDDKTAKDDVLNSSKISQSLTMASLGLEDVDVVGVDEGLDGNIEARDGVSVELSLLCPDNQSLSTDVVNAGTCDVDQKTEVQDSTMVAITERESSNDKMTPGIANIEVETTKVEPAAIDGNLSNFKENQGLIANPSNESNEISTGGPHAYDAHQFSYEEANAERGDEAGMDIDEVLGWKDETLSEDGSKKQKALDSISDGLEKRAYVDMETVDAKPSFKVGAVIQKVASQPTGPPLKSEPVDHVAGNHASGQADMLSRLHLTAQDPMKGHGFMNTILPFFKTHRAAVLNKSRLVSSNEGRKRKTSNENEPDEFEFDDVNDSYWTDRIIQNHPDEQASQENPNPTEHQIVAYEQEKPPVKPTRRSNKKRFFSSNHEIEANEQSEIITRRQQNLATEVLMKFAGEIYFPSEIHLNKMFRRFGPLLESETEVDRQSGRARVVFKKCSDAEVAHSSAGKFNIFGSINVIYELNYTPLISYKPLPLPLNQDPTW